MSIRYHIAHALDTMTPAKPISSTVRVVYKSESGILEAYGTVVPVDTTAGYAPLGLFWTATKLYANTGSVTSSLFKEIAPGFVGDITGDITGNVTGNVAGNVTGNCAGVHTGAVTGDVTGNIAGLLNATAFAGSVTTTAPTAAELVTILGAAGTAGRIRSVTADAGSGSGESYLVIDNGTVWSFIQLTNSA